MKQKRGSRALEYVNHQAKVRNFQEPGRDSRNRQIKPDDKSGAFFIACAMYKDSYSLPPSTKLTAAMAVIETWLSEDPTDKIVGA